MSDLYPFQEKGRDFLIKHPRAYLADECGLGKTVQACVAARTLGLANTLVIAPASAQENWRREWEKWGPSHPPMVMSYNKMVNSTSRDSWRPGLIILDEAHYCKNPRAKRALAALKVARQADRAWLLSATPMPNDPGELWTVVKALWPKLAHEINCHSYWRWYTTFNHWHQTEYGPRSHGTKNADKLRVLLGKIMLRRKLENIEMELPPLRVDVSLLPRDEKFTAALEDMGLDATHLGNRIEEEEGERGSLSRLRRLLGEYKAPRIADIIFTELNSQEYAKVVILCHHLTVLDVFYKQLSKFGVRGFDGSANSQKRQEAIDAFTNDPNIRVFVAQQSAAGVAINLQSASEVVLVEPSWVPDDNYQAMKRIHRIGQTRPCRARIFGVAGSLDEAIMNTVARKTKMQTELGL